MSYSSSVAINDWWKERSYTRVSIANFNAFKFSFKMRERFLTCWAGTGACGMWYENPVGWHVCVDHPSGNCHLSNQTSPLQCLRFELKIIKKFNWVNKIYNSVKQAKYRAYCGNATRGKLLDANWFISYFWQFLNLQDIEVDNHVQ